MELLALISPLNTTTSQKPLIIFYLLAMPVAGIWIYVDSSMRTGNACFWSSLAFAVPPIGVPLYYITLLVTELQNSRGPGRQEREERERMESKRKKFVMQGLIQREKEFDASMKSGGTMFNEAAGMGMQRDGFKYYTDHCAEELIEAGKTSEAKQYLDDLLVIARKDNDIQRIETCRFYLNQLK